MISGVILKSREICNSIVAGKLDVGHAPIFVEVNADAASLVHPCRIAGLINPDLPVAIAQYDAARYFPGGITRGDPGEDRNRLNYERLGHERYDDVVEGTQLSTDAHSGYQGLGSDFMHTFIDHAETYVKGNVHTNGIENFWALMKRGLKGTYVAVEPFHLFRYVDEQVFRFNNRKNTDGGRFAMTLGGIEGKRLTYKNLIGLPIKEVPPSSGNSIGSVGVA